MRDRSLSFLFVSLASVACAATLGGVACSVASDASTTPGPNNRDDAAIGGSDAGSVPVTADGSDYGPDVLAPSVVLVNGLLGDALGDIRVCPASGSAVAVPNDVPMPLANYPGIARGHGLDLGAFDVTGGIDVFAASVLQSDLTKTCAALRDDKPFVHVALPVWPGANAYVLLDDAKGNITATRIALREGVAPGESTVVGQFAFAVDGVSGPLTLTSGAVKAQSDTALASPGFILPYAADATLSVSDGSAFSYQQSLASVQHVTDPTTIPQTFYGVRTQFLFVLLGDPKVPYVGWKSPEQITGKELHVTAIPFTVRRKDRQ